MHNWRMRRGAMATERLAASPASDARSIRFLHWWHAREESLGCAPHIVETDMKLRTSVTTLAALVLAPAPHALAQDQLGDTVVVTATRQQQRADEVLSSVEVIDRLQIERSGQSTLVELLSAQPGLRVAANGGAGANASVFIRGAESRHTLVLIDGVRVGSATNGQAALEAIPLAIVERIEILRGSASVLYGSQAMGGVIQVFTRQGRQGVHPEVTVGYGTHDTLNASASVSGGQERLRYSLTVGHDRTDGYNAKRDRAFWTNRRGVSSFNADDDGFRNQYASASAALGFRQRDEVGFNASYADGRNWYDNNEFFNSYLDKEVRVLGVYMRNELAEGWTSTLRLGQSEDRLGNRPRANESSLFKTTQKEFVWQHDVRLPLGSLMAAYEHLRQEVDGSTDYAKDSRRVNAFLLGWNARIDAHSVQINARHDDNSQFGDKTTGLFAYGYQFNPAWSVRASIASAFNAPTFNDLYWPADPVFGGGGNPDLKPERALNRELGLRWDGNASSVELTYFHNRIRDMIDWAPENPSDPASNWAPANVAEARLQGVELTVGTRLAGYDFKAGVDYLDAKDRDDDTRLARRAKLSGFARVDRSLGPWTWGVEWNGAGRRYDNAANTIRLGGYGLLNAYAHYAFARDWKLELRANNLLDKDYQLARGYRTPGANVFLAVRYAPR